MPYPSSELFVKPNDPPALNVRMNSGFLQSKRDFLRTSSSGRRISSVTSDTRSKSAQWSDEKTGSTSIQRGLSWPPMSWQSENETVILWLGSSTSLPSYVHGSRLDQCLAGSDNIQTKCRSSSDHSRLCFIRQREQRTTGGKIRQCWIDENSQLLSFNTESYQETLRCTEAWVFSLDLCLVRMLLI